MFVKRSIVVATASVATVLVSARADVGPITTTVQVSIPFTDAALQTVIDPKQADVTTVGLSTVTVFANDLSPTETVVTVAPNAPGTTTLAVGPSVTLTINTPGNMTTDPSGNGTFWSTSLSSSDPASTSAAETPTTNSTGNSTADSPGATISDHKNAAATAIDRGVFVLAAGLFVALAL
ncbi:hypothetical protein B0T16DRAFT_249240 [Cercophora newfieldiana]|uniref:Uncharacterized protein n=1 Tax=Cercophora newfieldiana TaxID=92897 RepID=A0AA39XTD7_9PEZI|nr:hypothetical protein B0T16DRAFT_249240 [Cercophora newfieldiana]